MVFFHSYVPFLRASFSTSIFTFMFLLKPAEKQKVFNVSKTH